MRIGAMVLRIAMVVAFAIGGFLDLSAAQESGPQAPADIASPQSDQPPAAEQDPVAAMIGAWEFSNADHDKICHFNFHTDAAPGGRKLEIDKGCASLFPSTRTVAAWSVDKYGNLRLAAANGSAVIELSQVEGGMFDGFSPDEGRYILQAVAAAPVRSTATMTGDWAIARGTGKPICTLALADTHVGSDLAVRVKPGCDAAVTRFGPTTWRMDNGDLILASPGGQTWRFEQNDANTWQRLPEAQDPILLVRQ